MIESARLVSLATDPEIVDTPSASGRGQQIARCPKCKVALWSHYSGSGPICSFVRVGTLDAPHVLPPDIHIFTASKQPWVVIPESMPSFEEYYDRRALWSQESLERFNMLQPQIKAYRARVNGDA
jgi:hypothetical protein